MAWKRRNSSICLPSCKCRPFGGANSPDPMAQSTRHGSSNSPAERPIRARRSRQTSFPMLWRTTVAARCTFPPGQAGMPYTGKCCPAKKSQELPTGVIFLRSLCQDARRAFHVPTMNIPYRNSSTLPHILYDSQPPTCARGLRILPS